MSTLSFQIKLLLLLCWNYTSHCNGAVVAIFKEENFQGDTYEADTSPNCTTIPPEFRIGNGSLLTSGCVALFFDEVCLETLYAVVVPVQEKSIARVRAALNLSEPIHRYGINVENSIQAYRDCKDLEGSPFPNLDYHIHKGYGMELFPVSEKDICGCTESVSSSGFKFAISTHGNCFKFYEAPKCTGDPTVVEAIDWYSSTMLRSFEPCQIPLACGSLKTKVFNVEPAFDPSNLPGSVGEESIDAKQTFINNGTATMVELYDIGRVLTETAEIIFSESIRQLNSAAKRVESEIEEGVETTFDASFEAKAEAKAPGSKKRPKPHGPKPKPTKPPKKEKHEDKNDANNKKQDTAKSGEVTDQTNTKNGNSTNPAGKQNNSNERKGNSTKPHGNPPKKKEKSKKPKPPKPKPKPQKPSSNELKASVEAKASYGIEKKFESGLKEAFESKTTKETEKSNSTERTVKTTKMFQVKKKIIMPACTQYEVSAFITVAHDVNLEYKMQFEVRGQTQHFQKMKAEDIILGLSRIPQRGLRVLKHHSRSNNETVVVETILQIKLNFGLNSVVRGKGTVLWDCIRRHKMCKCNCSQEDSG